MLQHGLGTPKNLAAALKHFRASADEGCINANVSIGHLLANGEVARDPAGSARAFLLAAEAGDAGAANRFGLYCVYGKGVVENGAEAIRWLSFAIAEEPAAEWVPNSHYELGRVHLFGIGGVRVDEREAERFLVWAADAGDVDAAFCLVGQLGCGGPTGRVRRYKAGARKWARRAIALGKDEDEVNELLWAATGAGL
jgi:TPR repeat protein